MIRRIISLALADARHEGLLTACAVLSLAAMLTPLLVLFGVRHGIVDTLQERLRSDPRTVELIPQGSRAYAPEWFAELSARPETAFVLPQTRSIAAVIRLRPPLRSIPTPAESLAGSLGTPGGAGPVGGAENAGKPAGAPEAGGPGGASEGAGGPVVAPEGAAGPGGVSEGAGKPANGSEGAGPAAAPGNAAGPAAGAGTTGGSLGASAGVGRPVDASLIATAPGDPLLVRSGTPIPPAGDLSGLVLSASAAQKLALKPGDALEGQIDRRRDGRDESARLVLRVVGVLPLEYQSKDAAYVSLPLLSMLEEYRDGFAVPALGLSGNNAEGRPGPDARPYPTFRLYAKDLDAVEPLRQYLLTKGVEAMTKADEIEQVRSLNRAFTLVFALIAGAAFFGFLGAASGNALASVRRKSRSFGLLRLRGFSRRALALFPLVQSLLVGVLGTALACGFYAATAYGIDALFAAQFAAGGAVCVLLPEHFAAAFGLTACFSILAALAAAGTCAKIEPSEVIRDV